MGERLVTTITPADYPDMQTLIGRCAHPGCKEEPKRWKGPRPELTIGFLRGWFERHVLETGHSILIVEPEDSGTATPLRGTGEAMSNRSRPTLGESA